MRSSTTYKPPGVYPSHGETQIDELVASECDIAGFVGIAQKGPLHTPVRIGSWEEFVDVFGYDSNFYLSDSVAAFFRNGGRRCVIVRVAHAADRGTRPTLDQAAAAELVLVDSWNNPTLRVHARSEGRWGNEIWVGSRQTVGASALLTQDIEIGSGVARVNSTRGFEAGQLVRISDRDSKDYVILTEVGQRSVMWSSATPVNRAHRAASPTRLEVLGFDIQVALRERKEVFRGLQMDPSSRHYAPRVVASESQLIDVEDLAGSTPLPHNMPKPVAPEKLGGGRDGTDTLDVEDIIGFDRGPADRGGLMALNAREDVGLVVCPDAMIFIDREDGPAGWIKAERVHDVMIVGAENLQDRFAVLDIPRTRDIEAVKRWKRRLDSSFAAVYWPWLRIEADTGPREIPPSAVMAGIISRCERSSGVHVAPANHPVEGALGLELRITEQDIGDLNREGVNVFKSFRGIRPWGARTVSSDPDWRYISTRRIFIMLRRALRAGMAWVPFENNTPQTWQVISSQINSLLTDLYQRGMFASGKAEEAFYVKCDAETNPPDAVRAGRLTVQIGVAPAVPTEFIMITVVEQMSTGA